MKLASLLFGIEVRGSSLAGLSPETEISAVCDDSRRATKDCMFICLRGTRDDGHNHAAEAMERGALIAVCEHTDTLPPGTPYIIVEDTVGLRKIGTTSAAIPPQSCC